MNLEDAFAGFVVIVIIGLVFIGAMLVFALLGTAFGAFAGWIISISPLGPLVEGGFLVFGFDATGLLVHIGAMFGFVSGFIKGIIEVKKEKD